MSGSLLRLVLRSTAIAVAAVALIDPALTSARSEPRVVLLAARDADPALVARTRAALNDTAAVTSAPDPDADAWVVVAPSLRHLGSLPSAVPVSLVVPDAPRSLVRIERVEAPRRVPAGTRAGLTVLLTSHGLAGRESVVRVRRDALEMARATHRWSRADERALVALAPIVTGRGTVRLQIQVDGGASGAATADVVVGVDERRIAVLTFDARPSWLATFVRRALQADPALAVTARTRLGRGIAAGTTGSRDALTDDALAEVEVVVAGGLDALTASEVASLDRFARAGGALLLVPDGPALGAAAALLPARRLADRLSETPLAIGLPVMPRATLWASELAVVEEPLPGATVSGYTSGASTREAGPAGGAIVDSPLGAGRVLVIGALDAWRYRDRDDGAFDRAWPAVVRALAAARGSRLTLRLTPSIARPGQTVRADLALSAQPPEGGLELEAVAGDTPLRLLPGPVAGTFAGTLSVPARPGVSAVSVRVTGCGAAGAPCVASAPLLVADDARSAAVADEARRAIVEAGGGVVVESGSLDRLRTHLRTRTQRTAESHAWFPMRSAWWLCPLMACLGAEWFLRRRAGLR